ncbi:glycosyl transferase family 2 [Pigmentiphaga sp. NML030171]|nr:glycosyl transferase family 2 [Pigmentiphaga sp. NML030171]
MPEDPFVGLIYLLLCLAAVPATVSCLYLGLMTLLSWRAPIPQPASRSLRFDILVPAHNEAAVIERTVASLLQIDWPADRMRVVVIADNCSDDTARLAAAAGATVIERRDDTLRGKGYALAHGIAHSAAGQWADAIAVVDADTVVSPNFLSAFAARIERGAQALQANYGVLNPDDSWRTRIITIAYGAFHAVRGRARERLRVSCGLRGNGMGFTHELLRDHPFRSVSLTEDLEQGIVLGLEGIRVWYVDEAHADAELVATGSASVSQRQRWEGGRFAVIRIYTGRLLRAGLTRPDRICLDLALDLLTLPIGYVALEIGALLALALLAALVTPAAWAWVGWAILMGIILGAHILRGWQLGPLGPRALLDLARAPFFVLWKLHALLRRRGEQGWVKTRRDGQ